MSSLKLSLKCFTAMHTIWLICACFCWLAYTAPSMGEATSGVKENNLAGFGFSSDMQQLTRQRCYDASVSFYGEQKQLVRLTSATSFANLQKELGVSVSVSGSYEMFSANAQADYLRSIQDSDYSFSINYYQHTTMQVMVGLADGLFTAFGSRAYENGTNRYFGLVCGDNYVASYKEGALLIMGLNIKFANSKDKNEFTAKAGFSYGSVVSATGSIKTVAALNQISGSVEVHAFQVGGEPIELAKIFKKDPSGNYYAFSCSIEAMDKCEEVASGLLDYANEIMPLQISTKNNTGLTPLGIPFTDFYPIARLGLEMPVSFVTKEVEQSRNDLAAKLKENQYYKQKLHSSLSIPYPVKLADEFINKARKIIDKASKNVDLIMKVHGGAADCFTLPENCLEIKDKIFSQLHNITVNDLEFVERVKYVVPLLGGKFYHTGGDERNSWVPLNVRSPELINLLGITVTETKLSFALAYDTLFHTFEGVSTYEPLAYFGYYYQVTPDTNLNRTVTIKLDISPIYFEPFNITADN